MSCLGSKLGSILQTNADIFSPTPLKRDIDSEIRWIYICTQQLNKLHTSLKGFFRTPTTQEYNMLPWQ